MDFLKELQDPDSVMVQVFNDLYDAMYVVDLDRKILFWNKAAEEMTGYRADEIMGKCCKDDILNHIDENGNLMCQTTCPLLVSIMNGQKTGAKIYPQKKTGKRFPVETHVSPIRNAEGEIVAAIEIFRDVSLQEDYRIMQERFDNLIQKYVSQTTYQDVRSRAQNEVQHPPKVREMTVMYLDIVNFTGFSESHEPAAVVKMLNDVFGICEVITRECLGDIDKFIGDAIMAVFIDANDAVKSAQRILDSALPSLNEIRQKNNESPINIRIGINSGKLLQGDVGTVERKDYTVIGDTVNVAARIEKASLPNRLMISEGTLARLNQDLAARFEFHHKEELKGKSDPISLYILSN